MNPEGTGTDRFLKIEPTPASIWCGRSGVPSELSHL